MATTISRAAPSSMWRRQRASKRALLAQQYAACEAGVAINPKRIVGIFCQQGARLLCDIIRVIVAAPDARCLHQEEGQPPS
jgi:hypothetical protein